MKRRGRKPTPPLIKKALELVRRRAAIQAQLVRVVDRLLKGRGGE